MLMCRSDMDQDGWAAQEFHEIKNKQNILV
jgi:hypothetical protein